MAIPVVYDEADDFCEGFARVDLNGKWGFIDIKGNMAIPAIYERAEDFCEGLASVDVKGKCGYIDTKGTQYWED